jgi:drug/metabolite transporter (DMT)-like permease
VTPPASPPADASRRGLFLLLAAAALWSTNGVLIKALHDGGLHGATVASYRSLVAAAFLAPFAWPRRRALPHPLWTGGAVLLFTAMCATFVISTTLTTAANAIILQYTAPAWVFALAPLINRERAEARQWTAFAASMAAIVLIFSTQYASDALGLAVGLVSGMVFGAQIVLFRKVSALDPVVFIFLCCAGSGVLLLPVAVVVGGSMPSATLAALVLLAGVLQFGLPYVLYAAGNRHVSAQSAVLIVMLEPVLNPVWVYVVRGEIPAWSTIAGGGLILLSVAYLSLRGTPRRRHSSQQRAGF